MAIKKGINLTKPNEILLVAGKGHENYQIIKNKKIFFSDAKEIQNNL
jgi:UDP-N-acetylmuramoyl-L-alanyl-D-glutamate--2,6-diaminopimelate ligase